MDMIFSLHQLQEMCSEQQKPLLLSLISLKHLTWSAEKGPSTFCRKSGRRPRFARSILETCSLLTTLLSHHTLNNSKALWTFSQAVWAHHQLGKGTNNGPRCRHTTCNTINEYKVDVAHQFTYPGSTISDNLSLDVEIKQCIGKAATTLGRLSMRVWVNPRLTVATEIAVSHGQHTQERDRN